MSQEPETVESITLHGTQAKVIAAILQAQPTLTHDDNSRGGDSAYTLASDEYARTIIVGFGKYSNQYITHIFEEDDCKVQVARIRIESIGECHQHDIMDRLCAAWIEFRTKYLVPQPPNPDDHPF